MLKHGARKLSVQAAEASHPRVGGTPLSLECARQDDDAEYRAEVASGTRKAVLRLLGFWSRESQAIRGSRKLYNAAETQATDLNFLHSASLDPYSFQSQQNALVLHMWMLMRRLRSDGEDGKRVSQPLHEHFQTEVERRVRKVGVRVRVNKWLTELERAFYGTSLALDSAYDEGSSSDLARALYKNLYLCEEGKASASTELAAYTECELDSLSITPSHAVLRGNIQFQPFEGESE